MVTGTETELLSAWRTYSDFSSLADTAKSLRVRRAVECWHRLEALGHRRRTDTSSVRTEARLLSSFLTTLLEELPQPDIGVSKSEPSGVPGITFHPFEFGCVVRAAET